MYNQVRCTIKCLSCHTCIRYLSCHMYKHDKWTQS